MRDTTNNNRWTLSMMFGGKSLLLIFKRYKQPFDNESNNFLFLFADLFADC